MTGSDQIIASALSEDLAARIGAERFDVWFGQSARLIYENGEFLVAADDPFTLDRVKHSFRQELLETARAILSENAGVAYRVVPAPAQPDVAPVVEAPHKAAAPEVVRPVITNEPPARRPGVPRQRRTLEGFACCRENQLARSAVQMAMEGHGSISPLFLYGPTGCGKTHLLEALAAQTRRSGQSKRVVMLSAEQFTCQFLEALQGSGLPSFRRKYRDLGMLLIDDVQFFSGKRATIVELLHTIDTISRANNQLVLTSDRSPSELVGLGPEFVARTAGGLVASVGYPDAAARLEILQSLSRERQLEAPANVLQLMADRLEGDVRQLSGAMNRLQASAHAHGEPITMALAESELEEAFRGSCRRVRLKDVERAVCEVFDLDPKTLHSAKRAKSVSHPRMLAMWLARKYTRAAFSEIGEYFGRRSHSTVISAANKVDSWVEAEGVIDLARGQCRVNDALRRVEALLRTG
ncbi:DnaA ATPase domain-containing protein [Lignipirellula cremea]|uniref:Chromosomal replication initiator protein DnaA n=1 Tax=Lignipirellula cremea TaxID=2528010 RepID=A0A518DWA8_9BACT|nr:DnaA/Hda family protein [Lignipirellula cremea]QDU96113.1 Chromosomal replication initiator protein DnaA [Lignipirellula cremea]